MAGVVGRSGGHNRLSADQRRLRGSFRPDRHRLSASVLPSAVEEPPPELLERLGVSGQRFIRDALTDYEFTVFEAHLLRVAAEAYDDAAAARGRGDLKGVRAAVRQFLATLQRLGVPRYEARQS